MEGKYIKKEFVISAILIVSAFFVGKYFGNKSGSQKGIKSAEAGTSSDFNQLIQGAISKGWTVQQLSDNLNKSKK